MRVPGRIAQGMNVTVVIPTRNERDNLPALIGEALIADIERRHGRSTS